LATHDLMLPAKHNVIMSQLLIIIMPKCVNDIESPYSSYEKLPTLSLAHMK